ncbi:MAG: glycine cleavage system aminomethyltransferase GcvT, partial [Candidatus Marinimicrobia bacterium]|nr:glycine cleavage system aminomethyltransferase GcvT [Candidatus Neomarinimicrobiota bacterium]
MSEPLTTPLYQAHLALGAKMTPFGGYLMPVQYVGIGAEHHAVRNAVGLFDVSHMGEFIVSGDGALDFLQNVTINDVAALAVGQAQYSAMCREDGGMVDDLLVYRRESDYMLVVNAANIAGDFAWLQSHAGPQVALRDISASTALIAVQGPLSRQLLEGALGIDLAALEFYHFTEVEHDGQAITLSRTGYTGELGYELYLSGPAAAKTWNDLLAFGQNLGVQPAGLGARDTLRLEMKYCLYGNDISEHTNPIEAGLGWITKFDKGPFIGSQALSSVKAEGPARRLVCLKMLERAIARPGYTIYAGDEEVGSVTSGTQSPT